MRTMKWVQVLGSGAAWMLLATGCGNFYHEKATVEFSSHSLSYADVRDQIIAPRCLSCHTGGGRLSLQTYAEVKANLTQIERMALTEQQMPPGNPLGSEQRSLLERWIRAGAPEFGGPGVPDATPLKSNFASILSKIIEPKCLGCHAATGPAARVPLKTLDDLLNSPRNLLMPGATDGSGLWKALSRTDSSRMPPVSSGLAALSPDELTMVRTWIETGAPETDASSSVRIDNRWLGYSFVRGTVFQSKCLGCHGSSGGVNLEDYASLRSLLPSIRQATLVNQSMPKGGSLSETETQIVKAWFDAGAPEQPGGPPAPVNPPPIPPLPPVNSSTVDYAFVRDHVFQPRCTQCHGGSGGVNLETYASIKANLSRISQVALVAQRMPPSGPLPLAEQNLLADWIRRGAPERVAHPRPTTSPSPQPSPLPSPEGLQPSFASIKHLLFEPKCLGCHTTGGPASGVSLNTLRDLLDSPRELVLPGNPNESGLVRALARPDSDPRRMPPPSTQMPRIPADQLSIIRLWIQNGATP